MKTVVNQRVAPGGGESSGAGSLAGWRHGGLDVCLYLSLAVLYWTGNMAVCPPVTNIKQCSDFWAVSRLVTIF